MPGQRPTALVMTGPCCRRLGARIFGRASVGRGVVGVGGGGAAGTPGSEHGSRTARLRLSTIAKHAETPRPHRVSSAASSALSVCAASRSIVTHGTRAARSLAVAAASSSPAPMPITHSSGARWRPRRPRTRAYSWQRNAPPSAPLESTRRAGRLPRRSTAKQRRERGPSGVLFDRAGAAPLPGAVGRSLDREDGIRSRAAKSGLSVAVAGCGEANDAQVFRRSPIWLRRIAFLVSRSDLGMLNSPVSYRRFQITFTSMKLQKLKMSEDAKNVRPTATYSDRRGLVSEKAGEGSSLRPRRRRHAPVELLRSCTRNATSRAHGTAPLNAALTARPSSAAKFPRPTA